MLIRRFFLSQEEEEFGEISEISSNSCDDISSVKFEEELREIESTNHQLLSVEQAYEDQISTFREARLDYIITQVDISRMMKNASKHLDVESILALPTTIYDSGRENSECGNVMIEKDIASGVKEWADDDNANSAMAWSWQLVVSSGNNSDQDVQFDDVTKKKDEVPYDQNQSCVICLESFCDGDKLRVLPCGHLFHINCIDHWLLGTFSDDECVTSGCPTCKKRPTSTDSSSCDVAESTPLDGSVPSWAFARIGNAMAKETIDMKESDESCTGAVAASAITIQGDVSPEPMTSLF